MVLNGDMDDDIDGYGWMVDIFMVEWFGIK